MSYPHHPAARLFPMLEENELRDLAEDIKAHGLHQSVVLYDDPEIGRCVLDGRNRLAACAMAGVKPSTRIYTGDTPVEYAVSLNIKRRHLDTGQRAMLALEVEPLFAAEARRRQGSRTDLVPNIVATRPQSSPKQRKSRERAAQTTGTSGRAVSRAKRIVQEAPDLAEKVKAGQLDLNRADRIVRDRKAEKKRIQEAQAEAALVDVPTVVDLRAGDFREVLADLHDVDAIITDPPYPREFLPLLPDLAAWADKVLKPDGILAVLFGQKYLPDVYRLLDGHRPYRWTGCYLARGQATQVWGAEVQTMWKPILIYGGGPRFSDLIETGAGTSDARNNHKWGQDYSAFHTLVERLTKAGQTVVDPFAGSGTTLLAAKALGRNAIGAEIDPDSIRTARERLQ